LAAHAQYKAILLHSAGLGPNSWAYGTGGGAQVGAGGDAFTRHAFYWNGSAGSVVDINPTGCTLSEVFGISGTQETGDGSGPGTQSHTHAFLWNWPWGGAVDLNPSGFYSSSAEGISGSFQVGGGSPTSSDPTHALLWSGTAASYVDLHPIGFLRSYAHSVSGSSQVGFGSDAFLGGNLHALLWSGTAASVVDLTSAAFPYSEAYGISGNTEVGYGNGPPSNGNNHALMWTGTAASLVDINPPGITTSVAHAVLGGAEVGWGDGRALLWEGSSPSATELQPFLKGLGYQGAPLILLGSQAWALDADGNIVGNGTDSGGSHYAVMWVQSPTRTISGSVTLQNYSPSAVAGTPISVEIRWPGTAIVIDSYVVTLDSAGNFSFVTPVNPGSFDIAMKASHWLRKKLLNQTLGETGISGLHFSLINGDINGDNSISLADFGQLKLAYGSVPGSGNWNANADLDGNGSVGLSDFGILKLHYGLSGDS